MLNYEEFTSSFIPKLQESMPDAQIERNTMQKVNVSREGITIRYTNSNIAPTLYLDDMYKQYKDNLSVNEVVSNTVARLAEIKKTEPVVPELNAESAEKYLYAVLINAEQNAELLKEVPHEIVNDLAIIPRFRVGSDGSFIVKNNHATVFQLTSEEILEMAIKNTEKQEYVLKNMNDVMLQILKEQDLPEEYIEEFLELNGAEKCPMYVLSNNEGYDGAIAVTVKSEMEKAFQEIGEEFYVLPSSRHEVILVPESAAPVDELENMVKEVNFSTVAAEDRLSNQVYRYNAVDKKLELANVSVNTKEQAVEPTKARNH